MELASAVQCSSPYYEVCDIAVGICFCDKCCLVQLSVSPNPMLLQENMASGAASAADTPLVHTHHFQQALQRVAPSVSKKDQRVYDALRWQLRSSRGHLNPQVHEPLLP